MQRQRLDSILFASSLVLRNGIKLYSNKLWALHHHHHHNSSYCPTLHIECIKLQWHGFLCSTETSCPRRFRMRWNITTVNECPQSEHSKWLHTTAPTIAHTWNWPISAPTLNLQVGNRVIAPARSQFPLNSYYQHRRSFKYWELEVYKSSWLEGVSIPNRCRPRQQR